MWGITEENVLWYDFYFILRSINTDLNSKDFNFWEYSVNYRNKSLTKSSNTVKYFKWIINDISLRAIQFYIPVEKQNPDS